MTRDACAALHPLDGNATASAHAIRQLPLFCLDSAIIYFGSRDPWSGRPDDPACFLRSSLTDDGLLVITDAPSSVRGNRGRNPYNVQRHCVSAPSNLPSLAILGAILRDCLCLQNHCAGDVSTQAILFSL